MQVQHAYDHLLKMMEGLEIIDTHEHLPAEAERLRWTPDFSTLFNHYCRADLLAAGMGKANLEAFYREGTPLDEKWRLFAPYYRQIEDGSYCRAAHLAMERFYGYPRLETFADAEAVTAAIRAASTPGLYRRVLKEACRIRTSMNFGNIGDDPDFFHPVLCCDHLLEVQPGAIRQLEAETGACCATLDAYVAALRATLARWKTQGMKGLKVALAYHRDLHFAPRTHAEAEAVFLRVIEEGYGWRPMALGYQESRPLQDYLMHRLCEIAGALGVPLVIHSAMQAHEEHNAADARPLPLWNIFNRYPGTTFILLHGGFPWLDEGAMLAKHYANVYLDLAWVHLMSPEITTRGLRAWIDLLPMHKILGFGGDYSIVEKVYGHLALARQNIARALAGKMADDAMPLARAEAWIRALLVDNPQRVYRLA